MLTNNELIKFLLCESPPLELAIKLLHHPDQLSPYDLLQVSEKASITTIEEAVKKLKERTKGQPYEEDLIKAIEAEFIKILRLMQQPEKLSITAESEEDLSDKENQTQRKGILKTGPPINPIKKKVRFKTDEPQKLLHEAQDNTENKSLRFTADVLPELLIQAKKVAENKIKILKNTANNETYTTFEDFVKTIEDQDLKTLIESIDKIKNPEIEKKTVYYITLYQEYNKEIDNIKKDSEENPYLNKMRIDVMTYLVQDFQNETDGYLKAISKKSNPSLFHTCGKMAWFCVKNIALSVLTGATLGVSLGAIVGEAMGDNLLIPGLNITALATGVVTGGILGAAAGLVASPIVMAYKATQEKKQYPSNIKPQFLETETTRLKQNLTRPLFELRNPKTS